MRLQRDEYFIELVKIVAKRATCKRRAVGCILVDHHNHILSTGYNGVPMGLPHCNDWKEENGIVIYPNQCAGADASSGKSLDSCKAVHAEQNALLQCSDVFKIQTAYVTAQPCITCMKLLLNTSCRRIVFIEPYPHKEAVEMWLASGRKLVQFGSNNIKVD